MLRISLFSLTLLLCSLLTGQSNLYWANNGNFSIYKCLTDGSEVERIFETGAGNAFAIAVDPENELVFWGTTNSIRRGTLAGTESTILTQEYGVIGDIVVDAENNVFYFSERAGNIYRSNYDATEVELVIETDGAEGLALDLGNQKIYWTSWVSTPGVYVANLDGTEITSLATEDLGRPYTISLDVENNALYWGDQARGEIVRTDLDGMNRSLILEDIGMFEIVVEPSTQKIYVATIENFTSYLQSMNTDGSGVDTLLTMEDELSFPRAMTLVEDMSSPVRELHSEVELTLSPNPATSFTLLQSSVEISNLSVMDAKGRQLLTASVNAFTYHLDLGRLADGLYYANLHLTDGRTLSRKLIVQH